MTPRETLTAIAAKAEAQHNRDAWLAWHTAAMVRAKKMPSLKSLQGRDRTRVLRGEELEKRREERDQLLEGLDLERLNEAMQS
jgi:hypothetical protein